jgi:hypothetical protein
MNALLRTCKGMKEVLSKYCYVLLCCSDIQSIESLSFFNIYETFHLEYSFPILVQINSSEHRLMTSSLSYSLPICGLTINHKFELNPIKPLEWKNLHTLVICHELLHLSPLDLNILNHLLKTTIDLSKITLRSFYISNSVWEVLYKFKNLKCLELMGCGTLNYNIYWSNFSKLKNLVFRTGSNRLFEVFDVVLDLNVDNMSKKLKVSQCPYLKGFL